MAWQVANMPPQGAKMGASSLPNHSLMTKKANYEERCIGKFGESRRVADPDEHRCSELIRNYRKATRFGIQNLSQNDKKITIESKRRSGDRGEGSSFRHVA